MHSLHPGGGLGATVGVLCEHTQATGCPLKQTTFPRTPSLQASAHMGCWPEPGDTGGAPGGVRLSSGLRLLTQTSMHCPPFPPRFTQQSQQSMNVVVSSSQSRQSGPPPSWHPRDSPTNAPGHPRPTPKTGPTPGGSKPVGSVKTTAFACAYQYWLTPPAYPAGSLLLHLPSSASNTRCRT